MADGTSGLRHRGKHGTWKPSGDDAISTPQAQTSTELSAGLLDNADAEQHPFLAGGEERVFSSNAKERRSYMGAKWRPEDDDMLVVKDKRSPQRVQSAPVLGSSAVGGSRVKDETAGVKIKKGAFTAACAVLDVMPSGFSVKLFAPELSGKEKSRLLQYEAARLQPFDRTKVPHREALTMLWHNCHGAKPIKSVALGEKPVEMPQSGTEEGKEFASEDWKQFGFQGVDPATDFRGGGIFSLYNLVAFSNAYPYLFAKIQQEADYPAAVAGINISMMVLHILGLTKGRATCLATTQKKDTYTAATARTKLGRLVLRIAERSDNPDLDIEIERVLHDVYVVAFSICHEIWTSRPVPRNIMEFNSTFPRVRERMEIILRSANSLEDILSQCPYPME